MDELLPDPHRVHVWQGTVVSVGTGWADVSVADEDGDQVLEQVTCLMDVRVGDEVLLVQSDLRLWAVGGGRASESGGGSQPPSSPQVVGVVYTDPVGGGVQRIRGSELGVEADAGVTKLRVATSDPAGAAYLITQSTSTTSHHLMLQQIDTSRVWLLTHRPDGGLQTIHQDHGVVDWTPITLNPDTRTVGLSAPLVDVSTAGGGANVRVDGGVQWRKAGATSHDWALWEAADGTLRLTDTAGGIVWEVPAGSRRVALGHAVQATDPGNTAATKAYTDAQDAEVTRFVLAAVPTVRAGVWSGTTDANGYVTVPLPAPPAGMGWSVTVSGYAVLQIGATTAMGVMLDAQTANGFRVFCRQPLANDPWGNVPVRIHWQAVAYTP